MDAETQGSAEGSAHDRVAAAASGLEGLAAKIAPALYGDVPADDLEGHDARSLAAAATRAARTMRGHDGRTAHVDIAPLDAPGGTLAVLTVANEDRPFIVDSLLAAVTEARHEVRLLAHPVLTPEGAPCPRGMAGVSLVQIHIVDPGEEARAALAEEAALTMGRVNAATEGWKPMLNRLDAEIARLRAASSAGDRIETLTFLEWLRGGNFIFLGMRDYRLTDAGDLEREEGSGLGTLRDPSLRVLRSAGTGGTETAPRIRAFLDGDDTLIVTKADARATVHRRAYMDYVGVKRLGPDGALLGELRIVGLFTSSAYAQSVLTIPYLSAKAKAVLDRLQLDPNSHSGKALLAVLEGYPRDELFQIDVDTLSRFASEIVRAQERPRARLLPRVDRFDRFVSALVLVPKERYNSRVRERVGQLLAEAYDGHVSAYYPDFPEGPLARVHIVIGRDGSRTPAPDVRELEGRVEAISADWDALFERRARESGIVATPAFPPAYKEAVPLDRALDDARRLAALGEDGLDVAFHEGDDAGEVRLRLIRRGGPVPLSRRVPILENMGFDVESERTYEGTADGAPITVHDMAMRLANGGMPEGDAAERLAEAFQGAWSGSVDNDRFNALVLAAGLTVRDARILRAYARYLRQTDIPFSQELIAATLVRHPAIAADLYALFSARHGAGSDADSEDVAARIEAALAEVPSLDEDRILRRMLNAIRSTWRTNAFAEDRPHLAFKLDPRALDGLPEPRPYAEIFVYGPEVEGVHLRFGPVARGGLRWSDRAEDYRTEVLGLVKAQQVKNAVIVPVGAKGGFYPRALPPRTDRDAWFEAGRDAYKTFIRSLLSVTDNIVDDAVVPPPDIVRHDGDDPYFVVAADKGTATFSDTANGIAQERGFWLDDAFASGGSAGYDHKAMGITARGAWVAAQRHFREMGRDIQTEPFTVAGVGDMSGDVFGNGMLLSPVIRLVAAFDHRDIFIDPDPDAEASFAERKRLFEMGRSSWQDYDASKLSKGGGIHPRNAKTVPLSAEARAVLELPAEGDLTPSAVMTAILKARVDLMWFGGIGTYIKARHETNAEVGDRANDAIRIDGHECRALAIGEGANLGATQDGRVEYALAGGPARGGGAVNSDAVDNSAGVNSSDVEVNIKIALADAMRSGSLTREDRNDLLARMTDEVAELVLDNNYEQTLGISIEERRGAEGTALQRRLMQNLEGRGLLDRAVENLPDDAALDERLADGHALTRPEIGVLVSYAKLTAFDEVVASDVPADPALEAELVAYFPSPMRGDYAEEIARHRLRREIIATRLVNRAVNRGGPTLFASMFDRTGAAAPAVARAFAIAHEAFGASALFEAVHALDTKVHGDAQNAAYADLTDALNEGTLWALRYGADGAIGDQVSRLSAATARIEEAIVPRLPAFMADELAAREARHREAGIGGELAARLARVPLMPLSLGVLLVAEGADSDFEAAAEAFFRLTETFRIGRIEAAADALPVTDYYDGLALSRARDAIWRARVEMTVDALRTGADEPVRAWVADDAERIDRARAQIIDMVEGGALTVSRMTVAASLLSDLAR